MSRLILNKSATPSTPPVNKAAVFFSTDNRLEMIDENGAPVEFAANGLASIVAASAGINTVETAVISATVPPNWMRAGTTFRLRATGVCTSTAANAGNFRVRIGTAGTTADVIAAVVTVTAGATGTAVPFQIDMLVTIRAAGAAGSILGGGTLLNNGVTGVSNAAVVVGQTTATAVLNTTVQNILQLTFQAAATTTTCTFHNAVIEVARW